MHFYPRKCQRFQIQRISSGAAKWQYNVYEKLLVYEKFEYPANMLVPSFAIFFFFLWHFLLTLFKAEIETVKHFNSSCSYTSDDEVCMLNCTVSVTGKNNFKWYIYPLLYNTEHEMIPWHFWLFWRLLFRWQARPASLCYLLRCATNQDVLLFATLWYVLYLTHGQEFIREG